MDKETKTKLNNISQVLVVVTALLLAVVHVFIPEPSALVKGIELLVSVGVMWFFIHTSS